MRSARTYFWIAVFGGGATLSLFAIILWNAYPFAVVGVFSFVGIIQDLCAKIGERNAVLLYGITAGFLITTFFTGAILARMLWALLKTRKAVCVEIEMAMGGKLFRAVRRADIPARRVILSPEFLSPFCGGFFYPRIFVPLNTVRTCNDRELTTMLLHEKQHLESFDPFKTLVLRFVTLFLFAFPLFGHLEEKYLLASEIEADARASGSFRFRDSLLRAMRKMYAPHPSSPVVSGMASAMDMRIEHLLLPIEFPRLRLAPKEIILSIILSLAVCFAFAGSFHLRHALSVEVVEFNDGQMTRLKWESVSLFDAPHLYLTPITQSTNVTSCQGEAMNYTPL